MYPMTLAFFAIGVGLILLVWSANRFVEGAASAAHLLRMPPLLIGMVVVGFGTSAPEMAVSVLASHQGNSGIALGNAYGSNITNIALILGLIAMMSPISVHSAVLRKELPVLTLVTALAAFQLWDGEVSRLDAAVLLIVFGFLVGWTIWQGLRIRSDSLGQEVDHELDLHRMSMKRSVTWLIVGLVSLIASSRLLVWGAVEIASRLHVTDLVIGLTVVAVGTSLPELASSVVAARKGQHDLALGNILGSNLFNTLAVVGVAGVLTPLQVEPVILNRDISVMAALTIVLFIIGFGFRGPGQITRVEGAALLICYMAYTLYLLI